MQSKRPHAGAATSFLSVASGQPLEAAGSILQNSKVVIVPDMTSIDETSKIIKGIAQVPPPTPLSATPVVQPAIDVSSCERDYTGCPEHFVNIGPAFGGSTELCAASSEYVGPCASDAYAFGTMSAAA